MTNKNEQPNWQNAQIRYFKPRGYILLFFGLLALIFIILLLVNPAFAFNFFPVFSILGGASGWLFFSYTREIRAVKHIIEKSYPYDIQTTADAIAHILQKKSIPSEKLQSRHGYNFFVDDCAVVIRVSQDRFASKTLPHNQTMVSIHPALPKYEPLINSLTEKIDHALTDPIDVGLNPI